MGEPGDAGECAAAAVTRRTRYRINRASELVGECAAGVAFPALLYALCILVEAL